MDLSRGAPRDCPARRAIGLTTRETFPIVFTQRRVLPVAVVFALVGAGLSPGFWLRLACGGFALLAAGIGIWQKRARAQVVIDEAGYAVEEHGREKLRVAWSEVVEVRADAAEHACYVDCGDPQRNLLVPPERGYGFHFERADQLYARILDAVTDKVKLVERLEAKKAEPKPESKDDPNSETKDEPKPS